MVVLTKINKLLSLKLILPLALFVSLLGCTDSTSTNNNIVKYKVGNYDFDVSLYYHYGEYIKRKHKWPTPSRDRISVNAFLIDAILPEFQPWSSQTDLL